MFLRIYERREIAIKSKITWFYPKKELYKIKRGFRKLPFDGYLTNALLGKALIHVRMTLMCVLSVEFKR